MFQKGNKQARRQFFLGGMVRIFWKMAYCFPPIYCQKQSLKGSLRCTCSVLVFFWKTWKKYALRTSLFNISILNILNKLRSDHTQKASRRAKFMFIFYKTDPPQKCHVKITLDTVILHEKNRANLYLILPWSFGTRGNI